jgi:hypothetical protein
VHPNFSIDELADLFAIQERDTVRPDDRQPGKTASTMDGATIEWRNEDSTTTYAKGLSNIAQPLQVESVDALSRYSDGSNLFVNVRFAGRGRAASVFLRWWGTGTGHRGCRR